MNAKEIDKFRNVIGAKRSVADLLPAGADNNRMKFIVLSNAVNDEARPVDGHGISGLRARHDPKWGFVRQVPAKNGAFVSVATAKFRGEIRFHPQHIWIGMWVAAQSPWHVPVGFTDFAANEQARMKIDLIFVGK